MDKQELIKKIEALRNVMSQAARYQPLTSPEIQHMSHHLDQLLNQYDRLVRRQNLTRSSLQAPVRP
ncbi:MAG: aspartyl-phosphate phosphatase Spo0E family protein [Sporolactobacillus sp.]|uniref:aspartyl-phosphate phosphatase Spo0E family protein n=1 Tax=Sporolactobacillus sp. STSJ-5 TaxID=2965076 RepID=UPI002104CBC6|nr:aspartyl-phosphate phosphatase Spo0E family protein [Sporolactobacillus sp. STSJ-5]MCQ2011306.1 aspartyl-phosphate phosphatase Spo0E family protein [Sporolactobacillus sp. STSJ-5]